MKFLSLIPLLLLGSSLFAETPKEDLTLVFDRIQKDIKSIELENGLKVILMKRKFSPTIACYMKFKAGSSDETDETAGLAHMLEHMLFKGTYEVGTKDYAKEEKYLITASLWAERMDQWRKKAEKAKVAGKEEEFKEASEKAKLWHKRYVMMQALAKSFTLPNEDSYLYAIHGETGYNAYTNYDLTNYQVELPANRLEVWAKLESDRLANSVLRDFYTERNVVAEERRLRVDNVAQGLLIEKFLHEVYGSHPYGRSLIGEMNSILYLNRTQALDFFHRYYSPNNAVISIVGDIDFDNAEAIIRKYFSRFKPKSIPERKSVSIERKEPVRLELQKEGSPLYMIAWPKPSMPSDESLKLDILSRLLSGGQESRLFKKLVLEDKVATEVEIDSGFPGERHENLFVIFAVPAQGKTYEQVEQSILAVLKELVEKGITDEELTRTQNSLLAEFLYGFGSNASLANRLTYYEVITGSYKTMFEQYTKMENITTTDLVSVTKMYLKPDYYHTAKILPKGAN